MQLSLVTGPVRVVCHVGGMKGKYRQDCSFRGLSWRQAAHAVTAWACQTYVIAEARLKKNSAKHTWAETVSEVLLNSCLKKLICVWLGMPVETEPRKMFQKIPSVLQDALAQVCLWVLVKGLMKPWHCTVGAYRQQPTTTYWPGCQTDPVRTFLSVLEKNRKSLSPLAEVTIFSHTALWIIRSPFPLYTRTSHLWLCAQQSTSEVNLSSSWVQHESGLSFVIQHLFPKVF